MTAPIIATKLFIPPTRSQTVLRSRLIDCLREGIDRKLTLISAPAGFGKTTLVSEWVSASHKPIAWLSLDTEDNDLTRFVTYMIAALQNVMPGIGKDITGLLQSPQAPPLDTMLIMLINQIASNSQKFVLVLDDYHVIDSQAVDQALNFLIEHLPPQAHLVIVTREDPSLPLARIRAQGEMTELRADDLRFSASEAASFLNQMMKLNLSEADVVALETRTEGWIAGLQLAAISLQGQKDADAFIKSFTGSHHFIMDYLVEEVLQQQTEEIQRFLLQTSILERMCGSLCDALLEHPEGKGQEYLEQIKNANLFIIPLDTERNWFRYHHLFAELLRQRLTQYLHSENKIVPTLEELHHRASVWFEQNELRFEAFRHAITAKNFNRAANLAELAYPEMDGSFQSGVWLGWVKNLPENMFASRPVLCANYAWALLDAGELELGEKWLSKAEELLKLSEKAQEKNEGTFGDLKIVDPQQYRQLPASIENARAYCYQANGDVDKAIKHVKRALELSPEDDYLKRGAASGMLALSYWSRGELDLAYDTFVECRNNLKKAGNYLFVSAVAIALGEVRMAQGQLKNAWDVLDQSLKYVKEQDIAIPAITSDMYVGMATVRSEQGMFKEAERLLKTSEDETKGHVMPDWKYRWGIAKGRLKELEGDDKNAIECFEEAARFYYRTPMPQVKPLPTLKARIQIKQGKLVEARKWAQENNLSVDDSLDYMQEYDHITLTKLLIAEVRHDNSSRSLSEAQDLLMRLLENTEEGNRVGSTIEILVLLVITHHLEGDKNGAFLMLDKALTLAEPESYARFFIEEKEVMKLLLPEAMLKGTTPDFTRKLLTIFDSKEEIETGNLSLTPELPTQPLVEPLSQRELEILQLVADGLSNQEICQKLFLALSTVKGHNRNIFGKLQVQRRTEAVARAQELGLIKSLG